MSDSSIPVSSEFRQKLEEEKRKGESYEALLRRRDVLSPDSSDGSDSSTSSDGSDGPDNSEILSRLDDLEASIPAKTADQLSRQFR